MVSEDPDYVVIPEVNRYYHGLIVREEAERRLAESGLTQSFLLRLRHSSETSDTKLQITYVLSYRTSCETFKHFHIEPRFHSFLFAGRLFYSLEDILERYYHNDIIEHEKLRYPVKSEYPIYEFHVQKMRAKQAFNVLPEQEFLSCHLGEEFFLIDNGHNSQQSFVMSLSTRLCGYLPNFCLELIHPCCVSRLPYFHPETTSANLQANLLASGEFSFLLRPSAEKVASYTLVVLVANELRKFRFDLRRRSADKEDDFLVMHEKQVYQSVDHFVQSVERRLMPAYNAGAGGTPVHEASYASDAQLLFLKPVRFQTQLIDSNGAKSCPREITIPQTCYEIHGELQVWHPGKRKWRQVYATVDSRKPLLTLRSRDSQQPVENLFLSSFDFYPIHSTVYDEPFCFGLVNASDPKADTCEFCVPEASSAVGPQTFEQALGALQKQRTTLLSFASFSVMGVRPADVAAPASLPLPADEEAGAPSLELPTASYAGRVEQAVSPCGRGPGRAHEAACRAEILARWCLALRRCCRNTAADVKRDEDPDLRRTRVRVSRTLCIKLKDAKLRMPSSQTRSEVPLYVVKVDDHEIARVRESYGPDIVFEDFPRGFRFVTVMRKDRGEKSKAGTVVCKLRLNGGRCHDASSEAVLTYEELHVQPFERYRPFREALAEHLEDEVVRATDYIGSLLYQSSSEDGRRMDFYRSLLLVTAELQCNLAIILCMLAHHIATNEAPLRVNSPALKLMELYTDSVSQRWRHLSLQRTLNVTRTYVACSAEPTGAEQAEDMAIAQTSLEDLIAHVADYPLQLRWIYNALHQRGVVRKMLYDLIVLRSIVPYIVQHQELSKQQQARMSEIGKLWIRLVGQNRETEGLCIEADKVDTYRDRFRTQFLEKLLAPLTAEELERLEEMRKQEAKAASERSISRHLAVLVRYFNDYLRPSEAIHLLEKTPPPPPSTPNLTRTLEQLELATGACCE